MRKKIQSKNIRWLLLIMGWVLAFGLGLYGFHLYSTLHELEYTFWDSLYLTLQLIPLNSGGLEPVVPFALNAARFMLPLLSAAAAVQAVWFLFHQQIKALQMEFLRDHIIICGLSQKGYLFARGFREAGYPVLVIEKNPENTRQEECQNKGVYILTGDASEAAMLQKAGIKRARGLIAVCDGDGTNIEIALHAQELSQAGNRNTLHCLIHGTDPQLCRLVNEQIGSLGNASIQVEMLKLFERGARLMLQTYPAWHEITDQSPHLVILGMGRFGQELLVQAARTWWNEQPNKALKIKITVIDRRAQEQVDLLLNRHPQLAEAVEFNIQTLEIESSAFEKAVPAQAPFPQMIYICLDQDALALKAGLILQKRTLHRVPIIIRMAEQGGLEKLIRNPHTASGLDNRLIPFLVLEQICRPELLYQQPRDILAQAFHRQYALLAQGNQAEQADPARRTWDELPQELKKRNYQQVDHLVELTAAFQFRIVPLEDWEAPSRSLPADIEEDMARLEHEMWMKDRLAEGWRYLPGLKDPNKKTNPDLLAWADLPEAEREKNLAFVRGIPRFLGEAGYQLVQE